MAQQATKPTSKQVKKTVTTVQPEQTKFLFTKKNYRLLFAGLGLMVIGYFLMWGGSQPADQWDTKEVYGFIRITLSTIVVVAGFVVVLFSIFAGTKKGALHSGSN